MRDLHVDVNDEVGIRLTPHGRKVYADYWRECCEAAGVWVPEPVATDEGWMWMSLHLVMTVFGPAMVPGAPLLFETTVRVPRLE